MQRYKVGILVDNTRNYDREVLKGIIQFSKEHWGWNTYLIPPGYIQKEKTYDKLFEKIIEWNPDGIITRSFKNWECFKKLNVPLILLPFTHLHEDVINLYTENRIIGNEAAEYFINKGFQNFTFIGKDDLYFSIERENAFSEYIESKGRLFSPSPISIDGKRWSTIPHLLAKWLEKQPKPLAIFAASDEFSILVMEAIKIAKLNCPSDVALLGCDDDKYICELTEPKLSSIDLNAMVAGYDVALKINYLMANKQQDINDIITHPKCIVTRKSTDIIAVEDIELRNAIRFINEKSNDRNINVSDVVKATCLSRRSLEIRFKNVIGISILSLIKRFRINHFKKLLCETKLSIKEIYAIMDFSSLESATRLFKNEIDMSPSEYRSMYKKPLLSD